MSKKIYASGNGLIIEDTVSGYKDHSFPIRNLFYSEEKLQKGIIVFVTTDGVKSFASEGIGIAEAVDINLVPFTEDTFREFVLSHLNRMDVSIQDQHTPTIIAQMSVVENETTLNGAISIDDTDITVTDPTGFAIGKYLSIFDIVSNRFYVAEILNVVASVVTVDTPLDFAYPSGSFVTSGYTNMNVDGSTTPVVFGLRNTTETIGKTMDVTRILISCLTTDPNDLSTFGDIAGGITKGIVLRKVDGTFRNIFNAKTNGQLKGIMFDLDILSATNPSHGQDGFAGRLTFGGQNKMGVTIRLAPGEDLNMIIQDPLQTLLKLVVTVEGHEVHD